MHEDAEGSGTTNQTGAGRKTSHRGRTPGAVSGGVPVSEIRPGESALDAQERQSESDNGGRGGGGGVLSKLFRRK